MKRKSGRAGKQTEAVSDEENEKKIAASNQDVDKKDSAVEEEHSDEEAASPERKKKKGEKRKSTSKKSKKGKQKESEEESEKEEKEEETNEEDDDVQYEVEEIIDEKTVKGVTHYLIRWKGYDEDGDTWEPSHTLECPDLIKKFKEKKVNDENESPKKGKKEKGAEDKPASSKRSKKQKNTENGETPKKGKKSDKESPKTKKKSKEVKVDWESDEEFDVERILDVYFKKNGKREFLVSWKGYPTSQDSWEPEDNLECTDLIEKFMSKVDKAKEVNQKELRPYRTPTKRFTLNMSDGNRRLSRRLGNTQRVQYHEAE